MFHPAEEEGPESDDEEEEDDNDVSRPNSDKVMVFSTILRTHLHIN